MNRTLAVCSILGALSAVHAQEGGGQDPRHPSTEELKRRRDEAFTDAAQAARKITSWTAQIQVSVSNPNADSTTQRQGNVTVRAFDPQTRWLRWEEGYAQPDGKFAPAARSLYKGTDLDITDDKARILEKYAFPSGPDLYFPEMFTRDGLMKDLESHFIVEFLALARYMKGESEHTAEDWQFLGFKSKEEFDAWIRSKKAEGSGGTQTDKSELRPFKDQEDKFDKANDRNQLPGIDEGKWKKYTLLTLTPRSEALKRDIRLVRVTLTPETFLPISIMIEKRNDSHVSVSFSDHRINPAPEPDEKFFDLGADGFTVKHPQKED